jgi:predicted DNA-binding transcriptional regulator YafY
MDKTERLFAIMDSLRRHRRPVTAERLAKEHAVSVRTLYRDMQTLIGLGARIDGEAGVGYVLRPGFFLPPLMFNAEELEALVLGARWVQSRPDEGLSGAAKNALSKIATASPDDLRDRMRNTALWPVRSTAEQESLPLLGLVREAMRAEKTLNIGYADEAGTITQRAIWPVALAYYEEKQIIAAWCTMRAAFRNFRTDRVRSAELGDSRFGKRRAVLARMWEEIWQGAHGG